MFSLSYQPESGDQTRYFFADHSKKRIKLLKSAKRDNSKYAVFEKMEGDVLRDYCQLQPHIYI